MLQVCKADEFCIHLFYVGLWFNHATVNSRIRDVCPSDAFLSFSCIYFLLLFAYAKWMPAGTIRPWQCCRLKCKEGRADNFSPWGLPFGLQAVLLKIASLCLMPLLSQTQFLTWLSRSEMKPLVWRAACRMHCFPVVFRAVLSIRLCGKILWVLFCLVSVVLIVLVIQEKKLRARC